jgi:hypothetical protein
MTSPTLKKSATCTEVSPSLVRKSERKRGGASTLGGHVDKKTCNDAASDSEETVSDSETETEEAVVSAIKLIAGTQKLAAGRKKPLDAQEVDGEASSEMERDRE